MYLWENRCCHSILQSANILFNLIQIITELAEVLSHILNMNWLYHFNNNWKVWFIWFPQKLVDKFLIQTNISVLKKIFCWKITLIWKMTRMMLENFVSKSIYIFIKTLDEIKEKLPPKYIPKKVHFLAYRGPP